MYVAYLQTTKASIYMSEIGFHSPIVCACVKYAWTCSQNRRLQDIFFQVHEVLCMCSVFTTQVHWHDCVENCTVNLSWKYYFHAAEAAQIGIFACTVFLQRLSNMIFLIVAWSSFQTYFLRQCVYASMIFGTTFNFFNPILNANDSCSWFDHVSYFT